MGRKNLGKVALIEENKRLRKKLFEYMDANDIDILVVDTFKIIKGAKRVTIKTIKDDSEKVQHIRPIPPEIKKMVKRIIKLEDIRKIYYQKKKKKR